MRFLMNVRIPHEPFNTANREGTAGPILGRILEETKPEAVYFTEQNGTRGAVLIAAVQCGIKIFEYTPLEIKKSVVGYGRATKDQIRSMVQVILKLKTPFGLDTSDALAAAICHLNWIRFEER